MAVSEVIARFPRYYSYKDVADSFLGPFISDTFSLGPVSFSTITSDFWDGYAIGGSWAKTRGGYAEIETSYVYLSNIDELF